MSTLQLISTILFFIICSQLMVALNLYIWITLYDLYKRAKAKK